MARHYGDCEGNLDSWLGLYCWCEQNGYKFRDLPPYEKYINILEVENSVDRIIEIYIPVE